MQTNVATDRSVAHHLRNIVMPFRTLTAVDFQARPLKEGQLRPQQNQLS